MPIERDLNATLFIHEIGREREFEYEILLTVGKIQGPVGRFKLPYEPEKSFQWLFEDIEKGQYDINNINEKGRMLYEKFFPRSLQKIYWKIRDRIRSIRVNSSEPWIPWEIIKPWNKLPNNTIEEDPFLCQQYVFSRSLVLDDVEDSIDFDSLMSYLKLQNCIKVFLS